MAAVYSNTSHPYFRCNLCVSVFAEAGIYEQSNASALQRPPDVDWRPRPLSACIRTGRGIGARHLPCGWHLSVFDGPSLVMFSKRGTKAVLFETDAMIQMQAEALSRCAGDLFLLDLLARAAQIRHCLWWKTLWRDIPDFAFHMVAHETVFKPQPKWRDDGAWIDVRSKYLLLNVSVSCVEVFTVYLKTLDTSQSV